MFNIDSNLLYEAMAFYKQRGYQFISVPLIVDPDITRFTLPDDRVAKPHGTFGEYVGSAEQSIYQMIKDGVHLPDRMLAITPCQRDEPVLDESHLEIFLKIELASLDLNHTHFNIRNDVLDFLNHIQIDGVESVMQDDDVSYDINVNDVEVGSFGYRWYNDTLVSFGTGLALPRLSYAVSKGK